MAKQINISAILARLNGGESKDSINKDLELNPREIKALWSHEKLKNKKPAKYAVDIEIVDDTIEVEMPITKSINPNSNGPIADSNKSFE